MFTGQLLKTIDPRKLARQGIQFEGSLALNRFGRLVDALSDDQGEVKVSLHFDLDEYSRTVLKGHLELVAKMICQRCLDIVDVPIHADIQLMGVWTDEQAKALPSDYEPLFLQEEPIELVPLLEDELLLALPLIPYHETEYCSAGQDYVSEPELSEEQTQKAEEKGEEKINPFSVLAKLKTGAKTTIQES